ncbi:hypothetical protein DFJ58DRAFT_846249 [Suillus subalutaceus]|uniref:uncharacterized protein n=1 Tax=Suillus subalutaceus TaxID=48586 RepID=UPI001B86E31B|nr:uncharacterized protein DFJ58DRAFT_846249 [Suillus subalutaceus]KAG1837965.1 hypothetical protein DFJ58DRAFT_846249 [Suillus subalutaceus]
MWFLVIEPVAKQDGDHYEYYCADTKQHVIAWFDVFDASLLFQECGLTRLELEAQFWKHVNFFPHHYEMRPSDANELRAHLEWFLAVLYFRMESHRVSSFIQQFNDRGRSSILWILDKVIINF